MIGNTLFMIAMIPFSLATEIPSATSGHAQNPVWSSKGDRLAFEVNDNAGRIDLFAVDMSGTKFDNIKKVEAKIGGTTFGGLSVVNAAPIWNKRLIIFEHSRKGVQNRIYSSDLVRPPRPVIQKAQLEGDLSWPTLSTDGKEMFFVSDSKGAGDIYSFTFIGQKIKHVIKSEGVSEMSPRLNSEGKLLYTRKEGNGEDIYVSTNSDISKWVGGNGDQTRPYWVNNGVVFFSSERGPDIWDLSISTEPSKKKVLAKNIRLPMRAAPAITPDKNWVVYGVEDPSKSGSIWFTKVDGSKTFAIDTGHVACGDPSVAESNGQILLAYTALPAEGSGWRKLHVVDITEELAKH